LSGEVASAPRSIPPTNPAQSPASPQAALACNLPVASADAPLDGTATHGATGHGGFVNVLSGGFSPDASSLGSFDRQLHRWLPVSPQWVSPDGTRYAYPEFIGSPRPRTGAIHVVDVTSGRDRAVAVPAPSTIVRFGTNGIYIAGVHPYSDAPATGLSLLDPGSGAVRQLIGQGTWTLTDEVSAWGVAQAPGVAPAPQTGPGNAGNRVVRLNLERGAVEDFFTSSGNNVELLGLDFEGRPLVRVVSGTTMTLRYGERTYAAPVAGANPAGPVVSESDRTWFGSGNGAIWLYEKGRELRQVASLAMGSVQVAGGCI
jgi:hypothetical protein